ncbi:hypothetical protein TSOC_013188 [Tetrabaena socialis]|uniref:Uncharacterized protein n=1 Tax=Tetrabaena socialis TaxID=47790 RepID=A0A2J7ZL13_9CHLO|nr:hypothetical protein TSOC_013188 [Tetrabaena socialis]|eukprot:PNH00952.1 hypothetical protein TSOC_013188 [Tetrabaena socialis]
MLHKPGGFSSQMQEALPTAIAAVLANASGAGQAIARALGPLPAAGEGGAAPAAAAGPRGAHAPQPHDPAADWTVQLAVAAVLHNVQRHTSTLQAACAGVVAVGGSCLQLGPRAADITAEPQAEDGPERRQEGEGARPDDAHAVMVQHVKGLPPGGGLAVAEAMRKLDAAAFIEADPSIAPLLDRRYPEFEDTGRKQGKQIVFRYNLQLADQLTTRKRKAPKRGVKGLPHMGKES